MSVIKTDESDHVTLVLRVGKTQPCFLCGAQPPRDEHWSDCPFAPEGVLSDDDPDRDDPLQPVGE